MNFHLNRNGESLGVFPLDELRRKRRSGELSGTELVWRQGMSNWQSLDSVLGPPAHFGSPTPPPPNRRKQIVLWSVFAGVAVLLTVVVGVGFVVREVREQLETFQTLYASDGRGLELAGPVDVAADTLTATDIQAKGRELRLRHYVEGYKRDGQRDHSCDAESVIYLKAWIAHHFGGEAPEATLSFEELGKKIAADPDCADPLVLAVTAINVSDGAELIRRLDRALEGLDRSDHKPYPRFWITVALTNNLRRHPERILALDTSALQLFEQVLSDGNLPPEDQDALAENLVHGWGDRFFKRQANEVCAIAADAGPGFDWLALVLDGERHVIRAWEARGSGYANTVSQAGWRGFREHLAKARTSFTRAWELHPEYPIAASRMIYVAMGQSAPEDTRLWFDRSVEAQIDYPAAWAQLRWALRPRWLGSHEAMLALGIAAVDTGRFDTDVPRKLFDVITDLEKELGTLDGEHIYGRADIWPHVQRMYEGYLAETSGSQSQDGWRSAYAGVAYFASEYDVARAQLEAIDWQPWPNTLAWWETDLTLMPLEVAARTGSHGDAITSAEAAWRRHNRPVALRLYTEISEGDPDEQTREFVEHRLAALNPR